LRLDPAVAKAALVALSLFFGIGIDSEPDIAAGEAVLASQYVSAGNTQIEAQKEVDSLNACFGTYEVPPENRSYPELASPTQLRHARTPAGE
jgi:hypothetical protein